MPGGGNHTREFTAAAATDTAHEACYTVSKALAHVGMRVITDEAFLAQVSASGRADSLTANVVNLGQAGIRRRQKNEGILKEHDREDQVEDISITDFGTLSCTIPEIIPAISISRPISSALKDSSGGVQASQTAKSSSIRHVIRVKLSPF